MDQTTDFDFRERLDELRCHETTWLRARREDLRREQQRLRVEELAVTRILDERRALGVFPDPTVSSRSAREDVEVAGALESRPAIAAAAHDGRVSRDQLAPLTRLATPETDAEWALRGPGCAPVDLDREARKARVVTPEDAAARRGARELRTWREPDTGMVSGRFRLPDVDGVIVEEVLEHMAERMRRPRAKHGTPSSTGRLTPSSSSAPSTRVWNPAADASPWSSSTSPKPPSTTTRSRAPRSPASPSPARRSET
jgi:hypothetical protein